MKVKINRSVLWIVFWLMMILPANCLTKLSVIGDFFKGVSVIVAGIYIFCSRTFLWKILMNKKAEVKYFILFIFVQTGLVIIQGTNYLFWIRFVVVAISLYILAVKNCNLHPELLLEAIIAYGIANIIVENCFHLMGQIMYNSYSFLLYSCVAFSVICLGRIYGRANYRYLLYGVTLLTPSSTWIINGFSEFEGAFFFEAVLFILVDLFPGIVEKVSSIIGWCAILLINYGLIVAQIFLSSQLIQYLVVNIMHKSMTFSGRLYLWNTSIELFFESPFIGQGAAWQGIETLRGNQNAHNQILNMLVSSGIMVSVIFIIWIFIILYKYSTKGKTFRYISWLLLPELAMFIILAYDYVMLLPFYFLIFVYCELVSNMLKEDESFKKAGELC